MKYLKIYNENIDWNWDEEEILPVEFKGHEEFYNFLKDNNALDKWVYNFNDYNKYIIGIRTIQTFLERKKKSLIHSAFNWQSTPEKFKFWDNLDNKWINLLSKKK